MSDPQKTILLVEDQVFIALGQAAQLQQEGYAVIHAYSGEQAIAAVKANPAAIDLILMDINLGYGLDGTEAAQIILQDHDIPIVFLSSHIEPFVVEKTKKITSYGYVVKDTGITVLDASIKMAFKLHAAHQAINQTNERLRLEIADRRLVEATLGESEERFRRIFEDGPLGMAIVGSDLRFIRANTAFCQMMGYPELELTQLTFKDFTHPEYISQDMVQLSRLLNKEIPVYQTEKRYCRKDGTVIWGATTVSVVRNEEGQFLHILGMVEDITQRKQMEAALKTSEERFRVAQELALDAFTILHSVRDEQGQITDFEWVYVNPAAGRILRQLPDQLVGQRLLKILPGNTENRALFDRYVRIVESNQGDEVELRYDADGITGWFRNVTVKLGDGVAVSFSDITARKQAEEALRQSEARFRAFMDNNPAVAWAKDEHGRYIYLSRTYEHLFNIKFEDWRGKTSFELWPPEIAQSFWQNDQLVLATDQPIQVEEETTNPDGSPCQWWNFQFPFYDADGRKCVGGIGIDITARKQTEAALQQALAEKEMLMRELQHRVKNSLATAVNLIDLEQSNLPDERTRAIFANTKPRLQTMSALDDLLRQGNRLDRVDLRRYLHTLVEALAKAYLGTKSPVKIETRLATVELEPKRAMPLGLILNELVTNALKYAFPAERPGLIQVELTETADRANLCVADNGVGLALATPPANRSGLGLKLVELLARQIEGTLTVEEEPGVTVRVTFRK